MRTGPKELLVEKYLDLLDNLGNAIDAVNGKVEEIMVIYDTMVTGYQTVLKEIERLIAEIESETGHGYSGPLPNQIRKKMN